MMKKLRTLISATILCALSTPAFAATVYVTNTGNTGSGSLRAAITAANSASNTTIAFNIPTSDPNYYNGVFTILPTSVLPAITANGTIIDGSTQTTFGGNTNTSGPEVGISGASMISRDRGLKIESADCIVKGLIVDSFSSGIEISGTAAARNTIQGCYLGTDRTGTVATFTQDVGVSISNAASSNVIGGTTESARNIISGNSSAGILISGTGTSLNVVRGNYIGTDASGTTTLGSTSGSSFLYQLNGVHVKRGADANTIGGTASGAGNVISGNYGSGIYLDGNDTIEGDLNGITILGNFIGPNASASGSANGGIQSNGILVQNTKDVIIGNLQTGGDNRIAYSVKEGVGAYEYIPLGDPSATTGVRIRGNKIYQNGGLGINLHALGETSGAVTPNDSADGDTGPNALQNFPVITGVSTASGSTTVTGTLNSTPNTTFVLDFYRNSSSVGGADPSGYGEGHVYWGFTTVTTNGTGNASFSFVSSGSYPSQYVAATATNDSTDSTSEFSAAVVVPTLTVNVSPATFSEGAGSGAATGTVTRNVVTASALTVTIASSDTTEANPLSTTVTIPANAASATFTIGAVNDSIVDGSQTVTITASSTGFVSGTKVITVTDND